MDDFLILSDDKKQLRELKAGVKAFLWRELRLELHPRKANVFPCSKGIDFLGYVAFPRFRRLRKSTVKRFVARAKMYRASVRAGANPNAFRKAVVSWNAYAAFANSRKLRESLKKQGVLDGPA